MRDSEPLDDPVGGTILRTAKFPFSSSLVHTAELLFDVKEASIRLIVGEEEFVMLDEVEDGASRYDRRASGPAQKKDVMNAMPVIE